MVELDVDAPARVDFLRREYAHFQGDAENLRNLLSHLTRVQGSQRIDGWLRLIDAGDWDGLIAELLEHHYDPAYRRSRKKLFRAPFQRLHADSLQPGDIEGVATQLAKLSLFETIAE